MKRSPGLRPLALFALATGAVVLASCGAVPRSGALQFVAGRYERLFGLSSEQRLVIDARGRFTLEERHSGDLEQEISGEVYPVGEKLAVEIVGGSGVHEESGIARPRSLHVLLARGELWLVPEAGTADFDRFRETGSPEALRRSGAFRRVE